MWDRCGGPDVLSLRTDHNKASQQPQQNLSECIRKKSFDSTSSSEYSNTDDQLSVVNEEEDGCDNDINLDDEDVNDDEETFNLESQGDNSDLIAKILSQKLPTRITLKLHVTESTFSIWETVLNNINNVLYVAIPTQLNHEASKHAFISLLEFAEEKLNATAVVLCLRKDRPDRPSLVRTFMFLGFMPLDPRSPLAPPKTATTSSSTTNNNDDVVDDHLYLICNLED